MGGCMPKPEFKHLGKNGFPGADNVNVYDYTNDFDYARYDYTQMHIQMCAVPWDQGEAHVGERTMSGIGNVVYFGSAKERDAWFDAIPDSECFRWDTKFKELHSDLEMLVPLPFDIAAKYNYVRVTYEVFANAGSPVEYEDDDGIRSWFYFVRAVDFVAPNTTRLTLLDDSWQTWIYNMDITNMILERGHAPMFALRTDDYLKNPIANNSGLLTEDASYGDLSQVTSTDAVTLNTGEMWACIACTSWAGNIDFESWGTVGQDGWQTPMGAACYQDGQPAYYLFAMEAGDLWEFCRAVESDFPQFKQTIQGAFFIPKNLVETYHDFTFAGKKCYWLRAQNNVSLDFTRLDKSKFGYQKNYANIAKLYTYPYAALEITDENGNTQLVRVEDTTGTLKVNAAVNLAFPAIKLSARLSGMGGSGSGNIVFRNASEHMFGYSGRWYNYLREWDVPVFAIIQDNASFYDFATYYDRAQAKSDYQTAQSNANDSASAALANANASASTALTNANLSANTVQQNANTNASANEAVATNNANTVTYNASAQVSANSAINATSNAAAVNDITQSNAFSRIVSDFENNYTTQNANASASAETQTATIAGMTGVVNSAISGAVSGAAGGPAAVIGAVGGLVSGAISGASTIAQGAVAANLTTTQAANATSLNTEKRLSATQLGTTRTRIQVNANTDNANTTNNAITTTAANSAATMKSNATEVYNAATNTAANTASATKANAQRDYDTATANAQRTYNAATGNAARTANNAQARIDNGIRQAALGEPHVFGQFANTGASTTRPMALFANIITQSQSAIAAAGDEFLRYGYHYDMQWDFDGDWNVGKHFTFWKLRDFWVSSLAVPDMYTDQIRYFLYGGVTVWRKPEDIGNVSVYENFE